MKTSKASLTMMSPVFPMTRMTTLAAEPAAGDATGIAAIRAQGQTLLTTVCNMIDLLEEPFKQEFEKVKLQINTMLAGLPPTDMVPAARDANSVVQNLFGILLAAQSTISQLNEVVRSNKTSMVAKASLPTEIATVIDAKVTSGELVKKADHEAAVNTAKTDTETKVKSTFSDTLKTALKDIGERRTALVTKASAPVPGDELLHGEKADYEGRLTKAETRFGQIKGFKIPATQMVTLCWTGNDAEFTTAFELVKAVAPAAGAGGSPFAGGGSPKTELRKIVGAI